jgi:hypothetical protein
MITYYIIIGIVTLFCLLSIETIVIYYTILNSGMTIPDFLVRIEEIKKWNKRPYYKKFLDRFIFIMGIIAWPLTVLWFIATYITYKTSYTIVNFNRLSKKYDEAMESNDV